MSIKDKLKKFYALHLDPNRREKEYISNHQIEIDQIVERLDEHLDAPKEAIKQTIESVFYTCNDDVLTIYDKITIELQKHASFENGGFCARCIWNIMYGEYGIENKQNAECRLYDVNEAILFLFMYFISSYDDEMKEFIFGFAKEFELAYDCPMFIDSLKYIDKSCEKTIDSIIKSNIHNY